MKILFVYFSKKQMCETAEQAVEFVNGLRYRNQETQRRIIANEHTIKVLKEAFCTKWQTNKYGQPYISLCSGARYGNLEIATTGCGDTRIYGYCPLGDTIEEHDAAVKVRDSELKTEKEKRLSMESEKRYAELNIMRKGVYHTELGICVMVFNSHGNDYFADETFCGDIIAESGFDAYRKACKQIHIHPEELERDGNMSVIHAISEPDSDGFRFVFIDIQG